MPIGRRRCNRLARNDAGCAGPVHHQHRLTKDLGKLGLPGIMQLQGKAKAFLEARQNTAPVAAEVATLRDENKAIREDLEAAMQLIKELTEKDTSRRKAQKEDA